MDNQLFEILYPEHRMVTREWIISQAKDQLANDYMAANFDAPDAAIEENSRLRPDAIVEAMDILSDAGTVTFTQAARDAAEYGDDPGPDPEISDAVLCCPDCDRPNQFGQVCDSCERDRQDEIAESW